MKAFYLAFVAANAIGNIAWAADKPVIGPAPAWVKPIAPNTTGKPSEEALQVLLSDQQVLLEPGRQTVYQETVLRIQTPQGLTAGNISLPWSPDTDVLTVHKLLIRRGTQVVDVLASQTFTVVRREQNLESATLDGVLTANIQPEGLQVGDTLEFAASVSSSDPTLKGHVESIGAGWNGLPFARGHFRAQWPTTLKMRFRQTGALPIVKPVKLGSNTGIEVLLDNLEPIAPPNGAPARYRSRRMVELTDFASWSELAALMAPLYVKAATLPAQGTLRTEFERIQKLSPDPKIRAEAALALVEDRVRYVALMMGVGGYVPADAETSWSRRYGDCKGKTVLLLALLHALDIRAEPVMVSSRHGDGLDARLPRVDLFDHVLVRATIAGRVYWLDGTRSGDTSLDRLTTPPFGWGLPLVEGAALVRMLPEPLTAPTRDTVIRIDATAGVSAPAPTKIETVMRGDDALAGKFWISNLVGAARDRALKDYWKSEYDFIEVKTVAASYDEKTGEQRLMMEGEAKLDWANGNYQTDGTNVGYKADFSRDPGPDMDAPFAVPFPYFTRTRETILLPKDTPGFKLGPDMEVDQTAGGIAYRRHATVVDGVFTVEKTERSVVPEFAAKNAVAEQATLRKLAEQQASVIMPSRYTYTGMDLAAIRATLPTTSIAYLRRAKVFTERNLPQDALRDFDKAIELDPASVYAWASRGLTRIKSGDLVGGRADLAKAETLDPDYISIFVGRGMIADIEKRPKDAVAAYTLALAHEPGYDFALYSRAAAYKLLGEHERATADLLTLANAAIAKSPDDAMAYLNRGGVLMDADRQEDAIKDYDRAAALKPGNVRILADRGLARAWKGDFEAASKDLDAVAAIDPKNLVMLRARGLAAQQRNLPRDAIAAYTEVLKIAPDDSFSLGHRAEVERAVGDEVAALRDSAASLKLKPDWIDLYLLRANIFRSQGKRAEMIAEAAAATRLNPDQSYAYLVAANIYAGDSMLAEAMQAFERSLAIKPAANTYLNRARIRPKADLVGRQSDLDFALKLEPDSLEAVASKAEMQTNAGDFAGAIASYSRVLVKHPESIGILGDRGVAYARSGDLVRANEDFAAIRKKAASAGMFNELCWDQAIAGVGLAAALADCDTALAKAPGVAGYLDSRGLVLLRLGRIDEAIAVYDQALAKAGKMPTSLFGRGIAWARKGNTAASEADIAAALKINPEVRSDFERYGVELSAAKL